MKSGDIKISRKYQRKSLHIRYQRKTHNIITQSLKA